MMIRIIRMAVTLLFYGFFHGLVMEGTKRASLCSNNPYGHTLNSSSSNSSSLIVVVMMIRIIMMTVTLLFYSLWLQRETRA